jgi:hypothetical protein
MSDRGCSHLDAIDSIKQPQRRECEECVQVGAQWIHRRILGSSRHLPDMWSHALLRQLAEPARQQTRERCGTSCHRIRTAGGALVVLLSG